MNGSVSEADQLRDAVRDYVVQHLGDRDAQLVIDDTQAQKKGTKSVGVAVQYCGLTGDVKPPRAGIPDRIPALGLQ
ncbi:transposase [Streptomyces sp. NPDC093064]|uniref:transposase n=1 Tax=unclassified Streptomyces TaxID=2593676 RepID=UPI0036BFED92